MRDIRQIAQAFAWWFEWYEFTPRVPYYQEEVLKMAKRRNGKNEKNRNSKQEN